MKTRIKYRKNENIFVIEYKTIFPFFWERVTGTTSPLYDFFRTSYYNDLEDAKKSLLDGLVEYQNMEDKRKDKGKGYKMVVINSKDIKDIVPERFL